MAYESKGCWEAKSQIEKDMQPIGKSPLPKENSDSEITLNNRNFVHLKKLFLNQKFHTRVDLTKFTMADSQSSNIKNYNIIKNSTKKEKPLLNQSIYIKLTS